ARRERLAAAGLSNAQIDRVDGPVGLDIGAIGPSEIALSIAAAMVKAFHDPR
ncbi:XdhC family protein, partial [Enterococcus faecium]|uniref:XdhC family protein n=2 Tax=Bacteria TaxID=2 RepID=UPI003F5267D6